MFVNTSKRKRPINVYNRGGSASINNKTNDDGAGGENSKNATTSCKNSNAYTPPTSLEINGIEVHFPFEPYDVQEAYMASVLKALTLGQHALLESPTGTGKTLCLLCSALAWQRQEKGRILMKKDDPTLLPPSQSQQLSTQLSQSSNADSKIIANAAPIPQQSTITKPPVIIYASRTHSQLSQVVGELRNTRYRPKHAVLGSREHMCIHPKVNPTIAKGKNNTNPSDCKSSTEVNNGCNKLNKDRKCLMRNNLEEATSQNSVWRPPSKERIEAGADYVQPVLDMEDLVSVGKQNKICPFYHSRSLIKDAEIIFVPYNYLFDRAARETTLADIDFTNAILIFDEAHNLEEFASESSSFDLSSNDIAGCVSEVQRALQYLEMNPEMGSSLNKDNTLTLKTILLKFEKYLADDITKSTTGFKMSSEGEASYPGEFIFDVFEKGAGVTYQNLFLLTSFVQQVSNFIMEIRGNASSSGTPKLDHFLNCLRRAFGKFEEKGRSPNNERKHLLSLARAKSYRVHVTKASPGGGGFQGGSRTISFWCFAPALAMRELSFLKVRSIIITSGTLSPLPSFQMELGLNFPIQLENNHVIKSDQIFVRVVGKGVSGKELSSKFGRRDDPEYIAELGNTLASLCRNIPGGILVFFPSYGAMETAIERWGGPASERRSSGGRQSGAAFFAAKRKKKSSKCVFPQVPNHFRTSAETPWQRLLARKAIVLEPRTTSELTDAISEYKRFITTPRSSGAILMGVCRGKISEGIDFSDDMARAVVVTGLPFAPYLDPKVKLKREFLDAARASSNSRPSIDGGFGNGNLPVKVEAQRKTLSGAEWYNQQAHRAVNQAIGRVIRHRHDYGAILLLDHRFAQVGNKEGLSKWLRGHLRDESFGASTRGLVQFYKESKAKAESAKPFQQSKELVEKPKQTDVSEKEEVKGPQKIVCVDEKLSSSTGFYPEQSIVATIGINDRRAPKKMSEDFSGMLGDDNSTETKPKPPAANVGLGSMYPGKTKPQIAHSSLVSNKTQASSFGGIMGKSSDNTVKIAKKEPIKRRPQLGRKNSDAATQMAKKFFEVAQAALSSDDFGKVKRLLVAMKGYGSSKDEKQYVKSAKELIMVLVGSDLRADSKCIQLVTLLFPLLPIKYRYKIEKMASILTFEKSGLRRQCKDLLSEQDLSTVKSFVLSMAFNQSSRDTSFALNDRALLEDSQKVLTILVEHDVNLQLLFDLLPERQLRRVKALAIEMKRSQAVTKAKERSVDLKGEKLVNSVLFNKPASKNLAPLAQQIDGDKPDTESQKELSLAISQASDVNRQKKDRVMNYQQNKDTKPKKPLNPYQLPGLQQSTKRNIQSVGNDKVTTIKRVCKGASLDGSINNDHNMDVVDRYLHQAKSSSFVHPKSGVEKLKSIKANVPKGMVCEICKEKLKEPLMSECRHSACYSCWSTWLKRQSNCPTCRAPTTMNGLSKVVFTKKSATVPTLTQICNEESSDDEEDQLEIIAK